LPASKLLGKLRRPVTTDNYYFTIVPISGVSVSDLRFPESEEAMFLPGQLCFGAPMNLNGTNH